MGHKTFGGSSGIEELEHASQGYFVECGDVASDCLLPNDWKAEPEYFQFKLF